MEHGRIHADHGKERSHSVTSTSRANISFEKTQYHIMKTEIENRFFPNINVYVCMQTTNVADSLECNVRAGLTRSVRLSTYT